MKRSGSQVAFEAIPAAGVHGVGLRALPGNLLKLWRGFLQARRILRAYRPDVLFFTGGYVAVPVALAGRKLPTALFVPDIEPGLALKTLARFAKIIALPAEASQAFFPGHAGLQVTGYPTRADLQTWDRPAARRALDLSDDLPVVLVVGGSSGARSINRAVLGVLPDLLAGAQVVHLTGRLDWPEVEAAAADLPAALQARYRPFAYLHEQMGAALSAADLAVSRAGASTLGEFPLFGLPAILVPYPHAWRYQQVNAQALAQAGAARILADQDLPTHLLPLIRELLADPAACQSMRQAMHSLARPGAAETIARLLRDLAHPSGAGKGRTA